MRRVGWVLFLVARVLSRTREVDPVAGNDLSCSLSGACQSIQTAVDLTVADDVVVLSAGTYRGSRCNVVVTTSITIQSASGPDETIIDCEGTARGFQILADVTIQGLRIANGFAGPLRTCPEANFEADFDFRGVNSNPGGINPLRNTVQSVSAYETGGMLPDTSGGCILVVSSMLRLMNTVIQGGRAQQGGGLALFSASAHLSEVMILGNSGQFGGGIFVLHGSLQLERSAVELNNATNCGSSSSVVVGPSFPPMGQVPINVQKGALGGGVWVSGDLRMANSFVRENFALAQSQLECPDWSCGPAAIGGGIFHLNGSAHLETSSLESNRVVGGEWTSWIAVAQGGGLFSYRSTVVLDQLSISNNIVQALGYMSVASGGGCFLTNSTVEVTRSVVQSNNLVSHIEGLSFSFDTRALGAGMRCEGVVVAMHNTVVRNNSIMADFTYGGGASFDTSVGTVFKCSFISNALQALVRGYGAGLHIVGNDNVQVQLVSSNISQNTIVAHFSRPGTLGIAAGGGVFSSSVILLVQETTVSRNSVILRPAVTAKSTADGGGLCVYGAPSVSFLRSTVLGNTLVEMSQQPSQDIVFHGGGMMARSSRFFMRETRVGFNSIRAGSGQFGSPKPRLLSGGGIYVIADNLDDFNFEQSTAMMVNSTISENSLWCSGMHCVGGGGGVHFGPVSLGLLQYCFRRVTVEMTHVYFNNVLGKADDSDELNFEGVDISGGGLRFVGVAKSDFTLRLCKLSSNTLESRGSGFGHVASDGGGISVFQGSAMITDCLFVDNGIILAVRNVYEPFVSLGGGIAVFSLGNVTVSQSSNSRNQLLLSTNEGQRGYFSGGAVFVEAPRLHLRLSKFFSNSAVFPAGFYGNVRAESHAIGGAVAVSPATFGSDVEIDSCTFVDNFAVSRSASGGALSLAREVRSVLTPTMLVTVLIVDSNFTRNTAKALGRSCDVAEGGGVVAFLTRLVVRQTLFSNNLALGTVGKDDGEFLQCYRVSARGGGAFVLGGNLTLDLCKFSHNVANSTTAFGGGLFMISTPTFADWLRSGGTCPVEVRDQCHHMASWSLVEFDVSAWSAWASKASLLGSESSRVTSTVFSDNHLIAVQASTGAGMGAHALTKAVADALVVTRNSALVIGEAFGTLYNGALSFVLTEVHVSQASISNNSVQGSRAWFGAGMSVSSATSVSLMDVNVTDNRLQGILGRGAGMFVSSFAEQNSSLVLTRVHFARNHQTGAACWGAALTISALKTVWMSQVVVADNSAECETVRGGALFFESSKVHLEGFHCVENRAVGQTTSGSCLELDDAECAISFMESKGNRVHGVLSKGGFLRAVHSGLRLSNGSIVDNEADAGGMLSLLDSTVNVTFVNILSNTARLVGGFLSSEGLSTCLVSNSRLWNNSAYSGSVVHSPIGNLVSRWTTTSVHCETGSCVTLISTSASLFDSTLWSCRDTGVEILVSQNARLVELNCRRCEASTFAAVVATSHNDLSCQSCPYGARCRGSHDANSTGLSAARGFWGSLQPSGLVEFSRCPPGYCCTTDCSYADCAPHREGVLCGTCEAGYGEVLFSVRCVPSDQCRDGVWFFPVLVIAGTLWASFLLVKSDALPDPLDGLAGVMMNFYQVAPLTRTLPWQHTSTGLVEGLQTVFTFSPSGSTTSTIGVCVLPAMEPRSKIWFGIIVPAVVMLSLPLAVMARWGLRRILGDSLPEKLLRPVPFPVVIATAFRVATMCFLSVVFSALRMLQCVDVDGTRRWFFDANHECWEAWQLVPFLVLLAVLPLPGVAMLKFAQKQDADAMGPIRKACARALLSGLASERSWWFCLVLYRRFVVALTVVAVLNLTGKAIILAATLSLSLLASVTLRPYRSPVVTFVDVLTSCILALLALLSLPDMVHAQLAVSRSETSRSLEWTQFFLFLIPGPVYVGIMVRKELHKRRVPPTCSLCEENAGTELVVLASAGEEETTCVHSWVVPTEQQPEWC